MTSTRHQLLRLFAISLSTALLTTVAILYAQGVEIRESDIAAGNQTMATSAATVVNWDSIYGLINDGFRTLEPVLKKGCLDCHSDKTRYPWYYKLPVVKGIIDEDIRDARKHLDMSNGFPFKGHGKPADDLAGIKEEIVEGAMPPSLYRLFHWGAKPDKAEADSIVFWVDRSLSMLAAHGVVPTED